MSRAPLARVQWAHRLASGGASVHSSREEAEAAREEYLRAPRDPLGPRPPASLGIWRRRVSEWEPAP